MSSPIRPTVHSLYWQNVDPMLVAGQARVFEHLDIPLAQDLCDRMAHGAWMDALLAAPGDDVLVICDIDALPLQAQAFDRLVAVAEAGGIAGLAQTSNHLANPHAIYAGPMFLALRRSVWRKLGCPSMAPTASHDAGQLLSMVAKDRGVPVEVAVPNTCLKPMWNLAGKRVFGIATFYGENEFFHLFQSRKKRNIQLFAQLCDDVVAGQPFDFGKYLVTLNGKNRVPKILRRYFA